MHSRALCPARARQPRRATRMATVQRKGQTLRSASRWPRTSSYSISQRAAARDCKGFVCWESRRALATSRERQLRTRSRRVWLLSRQRDTLADSLPFCRQPLIALLVAPTLRISQTFLRRELSIAHAPLNAVAFSRWPPRRQSVVAFDLTAPSAAQVLRQRVNISQRTTRFLTMRTRNHVF